MSPVTLPYPQQIVAILPETLAGLAGDVDAAEHPGDEDTLGMEDAALTHIVDASLARSIDPTVPDAVRALARRAIAAGHGSDGFSAWWNSSNVRCDPRILSGT